MASKNGFQRDAEHSLAAQHARAAGLYPGARFSSKADVRAVCATLCNKSNRKVAVKKSNKVKVVVCCRVVPCTFRVVARTATEGTAVNASGRCPEGAWVATVVVADHTCTEADIAASSSRNTPAASIDDKTLATACNPLTQAKLVAKRASVHEAEWVNLNGTLPATRTFLVRDEPRRRAYGDPCTEFRELRCWGSAVEAADPDSHVLVKIDTSHEYSHEVEAYSACAVVLGPCARMFRAGRQLVVLGASFATGGNSGGSMCIVSADANNHVYPVAFAHAAGEPKDAWSWFVSFAVRHVPELNVPGVVAMASCDDSVSEAVSTFMPSAMRIRCMLHRQRDIGAFCRSRRVANAVEKRAGHLYAIAAKAYQRRHFEAAMDALRALSEPIFDYVMATDPSEWARSHMDFVSFDAITSSWAESWHDMFKIHMEHSAPTFLKQVTQRTFEQISQYATEAREGRGGDGDGGGDGLADSDADAAALVACGAWSGHPTTDLVPSSAAMKQLHLCTHRARALRAEQVDAPDLSCVVPSSRRDGHAYRVRATTRYCACGVWQASGLPCEHAVALLTHPAVMLEASHFIHPALSQQANRQMYELAGMLAPMDTRRLMQDRLRPPAAAAPLERPRKRPRSFAGETKARAGLRCRQATAQAQASAQTPKHDDRSPAFSAGGRIGFKAKAITRETQRTCPTARRP